jgi:hypothetical protein
MPETRVADPLHFIADPYPAFKFNADPDPALQFNADPIPYQGDANLRPLVYRPSRPLFYVFTLPLCASTAPFLASKAPEF